MSKRGIPEKEWVWFGQPGHFCAAAKCRYHLHTHVGRYCVSTVGEYYVRPDDKEPTPPAASPHLYETMVFPLDEKAESVTNYNELEGSRNNTREDAQQDHMLLCAKYASKEEPS